MTKGPSLQNRGVGAEVLMKTNIHHHIHDTYMTHDTYNQTHETEVLK